MMKSLVIPSVNRKVDLVWNLTFVPASVRFLKSIYWIQFVSAVVCGEAPIPIGAFFLNHLELFSLTEIYLDKNKNIFDCNILAIILLFNSSKFYCTVYFVENGYLESTIWKSTLGSSIQTFSPINLGSIVLSKYPFSTK